MSLLRKASIVTTPTAYENGKILSVKPAQSFSEELVTNGNFSTDSDWTKGTGWTIANGKANANTSGSFVNLTQNNIFQTGKTYITKFTITDYTQGEVRLTQAGIDISGSKNSIGAYTTTFTSSSSDGRIIMQGLNSFIGSIDNVSIKEITDADFDFTRNSSATRVNSQGLIEDMQILSGDLVSNGDFSQEGSELITNGDFATDTNWSKSSNWTISGGAANSNGSNGAIYQNIGLVSGKTYKVNVEVSLTSGSLYVREGNNGSVAETITQSGSYEIYLISGTATSQVGYIQFYSISFNGSIDNVSVKEVGQDWALGTGWSIGDGFVEANNTSSFISQSGLIQASKLYRLTFEARLKSGTNGTIKAYIGGSNNQQFTIDSTNWQSFTYVNTRGGSNADSIYFNNNGTELELDNISLIEITEDTNLPRIDYTGGEGHWLFEPQSTNSFQQSNQFDTTWQISSSDVSVTPNQIGVGGSTDAWKLTEGSFSGEHFIRQTPNIGGVVSVSVYAKAGTNDFLYIRGVTSGVNKRTWFNLSNGTVGTNQGISAEMISMGDGWYRCVMVLDHQTAFEYYIAVSNADGVSSYQGSNKYIYIQNAQLEQNSFATSYIPTEGSIKTRLADAAFGAGSSDLINSTEGVLYAEIAALANDGTNRIISLSDGTVANMLLILYQIGSNVIRTQLSVSGQSNIVIDVNSDTTISSKIAVKYDSTSIKFYLNGSKVGETSTGYTFSSNVLDNLSFTYGSGILPFFGKAKCVAVFKEALNNDELECLTGEGYDSFNALALANNYTII